MYHGTPVTHKQEHCKQQQSWRTTHRILQNLPQQPRPSDIRHTLITSLLQKWAKTQRCDKLSLLLELHSGSRHDAETCTQAIERLTAKRRFMQPDTNVIPLRKPPQSANAAKWRSQAAWTGVR